MAGQESEHACSFCGKKHSEVKTLIGSTHDINLYICDACVLFFYEILSEEGYLSDEKPN